MSMPQGVTFDTASGIDLTGWWSNPKTGTSYRIVDQFFQDNMLCVRTDKGQILNYNDIQNLVKTDGPLSGPIIPPQQENMNTDVLLEGLDEDEADILSRPIRSQATPEPAKKESVNQVIIEKAFSKAQEGPKLALSIAWDWKPLKQTIEMLTDTMDVPIGEITDYVYSKYAESMVGDIKKMLGDFLVKG